MLAISVNEIQELSCLWFLSFFLQSCNAVICCYLPTLFYMCLDNNRVKHNLPSTQIIIVHSIIIADTNTKKNHGLHTMLEN
jgi:hypothetical protein